MRSSEIYVNLFQYNILRMLCEYIRWSKIVFGGIIGEEIFERAFAEENECVTSDIYTYICEYLQKNGFI